VIKVSDVVPSLREKHLVEIKEAIERLQCLTLEYSKMDSTVDLHRLEALKREYNGELLFFTNLYGNIKRYKSAGHSYFEDVLKRVKAEAVNIMLNQIDPVTGSRYNVTSVERQVYQYPYYTDRFELIQKLRGQFERAEKLHGLFNETFQSIRQSISVAAKEYENQKTEN
jgi:hypothetical protein